MRIGSVVDLKGTCTFTVWAPFHDRVEVKVLSPEERIVPMEKDEQGYWRAEASNFPPGVRYRYRLDSEKERPDPASRFQPGGVHGPSEIINHASFTWDDQGWKGPALREYVLYELHTGTFTPEGTFDAIIPHLDYLRDLGIAAIELMPVSQFPGARNWGYDGVYPYAVQNSYGGPEGLKRLVNACHGKGLAVVLDVVYNHFGPEGNYLWDYGPYFTDRYKTPWGDAVNFDGPYSDEVRNYFIGSALGWITDYHIDALRIDAVHGIFDFSARHFLQELAERIHSRAGELNRNVFVIAESDLNDVRLIDPGERGGYGLDAQWNDDFHHALHALLTGEQRGYYSDFGTIGHLSKAFREGFVYSGEYSEYRKRRHGGPSRDATADRFVVFSQNHDQVGNRMEGERLSSLVTFEQYKLAAGAVLLSPFIPLLFMGEEYGETAPFLYFVSHGDEALIDAVRKGRREEFSHFHPAGTVPDPQAEETFRRSKIDFELRNEKPHENLLAFYKALLRLRRELAPLANLSKAELEVQGFETEKTLLVRRRQGDDMVFVLFHFGDEERVFELQLPEGTWEKALDSSELRWKGAGSVTEPSFEAGAAPNAVRISPHSFVLYRRIREGL